MSKAAYWQRGEALDYNNATDATIEAGSVVTLGTRIGIAGMDIAPSQTGSVHVEGVYRFAKTGTAAVSMGAAVYYDGTGITNAEDGGTPAGYAAADAAAADTEILVKLLG